MNARMLEAALDYAAQGWQVLPCKWAGTTAKAPLIAGGYRSATTDPDTIRRWWQRWPLALVGLVPAPGVVVLDVDPRNGGSLADLEDLNGAPLPPTATVRTGSGGWHLYYTAPGGRFTAHPKRAGKALAGIDVKHGGTGYVVAPPSIHPGTGVAYTWEDPAHGLTALPQGLADAITVHPNEDPAASAKRRRIASPRKRRGAESMIARYRSQVREGERNHRLYALACTFYREGQDLEVLDALAGAGIAVGLDPEEVRATIRSAWTRFGRSA